MYPHVVTDLLVNCSAHIDVMEMEKLLRGEIGFHLTIDKEKSFHKTPT